MENVLTTKQQLIKAIYHICRNYHQFEDSGIIQHLESRKIKNQADLRKIDTQGLKDLSHELLDIFRTFMNLPSMANSKKTVNAHFVKYYQPLTHLLKTLN